MNMTDTIHLVGLPLAFKSDFYTKSIQHLAGIDLVENKEEHITLILQQLETEKADLAICPLSQIPVNLPENIVITALSQRDYPKQFLVIPPTSLDKNKVLNLAEGVTVFVDDLLIEKQLLDIRKDLNIQQGTDLNVGHKEAFVIKSVQPINEDQFSNCKIIALHPSEFVQAPGTGVYGILCRKNDLPLRRKLKPLHQPETTKLTNIERTIQKGTSENTSLIGVYAAYEQGLYCVWAVHQKTDATALHFASLRSVTFTNLAEQILAEYK